ncbi:MAG: hypothetical protein LBD77_03365 [Bifidobacteriaceae bacterium]|jgi:hypothetical protein|nr:hypothetical protein [Bifidobacteriaceae bacterium]
MTPQLTIVRGAATAEELAALTASLAALAGVATSNHNSPDAVPRPTLETAPWAGAGQTASGNSPCGRRAAASAWRGRALGWKTPGPLQPQAIWS